MGRHLNKGRRDLGRVSGEHNGLIQPASTEQLYEIEMSQLRAQENALRMHGQVRYPHSYDNHRSMGSV